MRFELKADDIGAVLKGTGNDVERAVTAAMDDVTAGLKGELREQITGAGLGTRLANTWRGKRYPESGQSADAVAFVWSKAPAIIDAFERGVTIRSKRKGSGWRSQRRRPARRASMLPAPRRR